MSDDLDDLEEAAAAGPIFWPGLQEDDLDVARMELTTWVEILVDRFPNLTYTAIPPCWPAHNALVETLQGLRDFERASYAQDSLPTAAVDWSRALREGEVRLAELNKSNHCTANSHDVDKSRTWSTREDLWDGCESATLRGIA